MHHLVKSAAGSRVVPDEDTVLHHMQGHRGTVRVVVQALDVSTWPL